MKGRRRMTQVCVQLLLVLIFTIASFGIVTLGAKVYQIIEKNHEKQFNEYTPWIYILMKVRQHDRQGQIRVEQVGKHTALVLGEVCEGQKYETWIFAYDGMLYEEYVLAGDPAMPGYGSPVMTLKDIEWQLKDKKSLEVKFEFTEGRSLDMTIALSSGGGTDEKNGTK